MAVVINLSDPGAVPGTSTRCSFFDSFRSGGASRDHPLGVN
jgi:hypothetical protein